MKLSVQKCLSLGVLVIKRNTCLSSFERNVLVSNLVGIIFADSESTFHSIIQMGTIPFADSESPREARRF